MLPIEYSPTCSKGNQVPCSAGLPPGRAITHGPYFHWFGYYDKLEFGPSQRYVLGMRVAFEHRSPQAQDAIRVGMVDLEDADHWIELGSSKAWCWQQGCMLQWHPRSREVLWNDRQDDRFVCHILDTATGQRKTLAHPIYAVSPDGRTAIAPDFRRINDMRPGYGYGGLPDPNSDVLAPANSGIYRLDLQTGERELLITLAEVAALPYPRADLGKAKHYFNHLLFNPDGTRFVFLHRWRLPGQETFGTRMLTAAKDGTAIRVVDDYGHTSHFIWRDPTHLLAWAYHPSHEMAFYLYEDSGRDARQREQDTVAVGPDVMTVNGHCSYLPGNEWILNDTYPDLQRIQHLYLYHVPTGTKVPLGDFESPQPYRGEWRCDLHPRFSPDGQTVVMDSAHGGNGRQMYLIDISAITA
jgi:hypothetical protein